MEKCWFVLRQRHYAPPEYTHPSKKSGLTTAGALCLGDAVTGPKKLYPILTQEERPEFSVTMRISSMRLAEFSWSTHDEREHGFDIAADAPAAAAAGITVGANLYTEFKRTNENWSQFDALDVEVVQPSKGYINKLLEVEDVKDHVSDQKLPLVDRWTVYVVTGLMIARGGGTVGQSESHAVGFGGGPNVDVPGVVGATATASRRTETGNSVSATVQGDFIWAIRFAKVHKGVLRQRWTQTEETEGAALDADGEDAEAVPDVLDHIGIKDHGDLFQLADGQETEFLNGVIFVEGTL